MTTTFYEELPLLYKNIKKPGSTLILSFNVNSRNQPVRGEFLWAIHHDDKTVEASGIVKGLKKLDKIRNQFILEGWERYSMPKFKVRREGEQRETPIIVEEGEMEKIEARLTSQDKEARSKAMTDIAKHTTPFSQWLLEN